VSLKVTFVVRNLCTLNFSALTPEVTFLICVPSYCYWAKIGVYDLHSSRWHFHTRFTIDMSLGAFEAGMDMYISQKFGGLLSGTSAVNVNCVQEASISRPTRVNSSTFTKGQHVCVSLLLAD